MTDQDSLEKPKKTMTKKPKPQTRVRPLNLSPGQTDQTKEKEPKEEEPCPTLTSSDYKRLNRGEADKELIDTYIKLRTAISQNDILERSLWSMKAPNAEDHQEAIERSKQIHHQIVWEQRRELVIQMNSATLDSLARHYGILPGAECVHDHPDANDLDKGLLLARLRQFLVWDGEYLGTAPEMHAINVEAVKEAAESGANKPLPPETTPIESVLVYASGCKKANAGILHQALKDCVSVTCACPAIERRLILNVQHIQRQADDLREQVPDLDEYANPPKKRVMDADEQHGSLEQLIAHLGQTLQKIATRSKITRGVGDDRYVRQTLTDLKSETQKLDSRHNAAARSLDEVRSYREQFTPGKDMPQILEDATDKWFTSQFIPGTPVGSVVRMAWLLDVFQSFWKSYQSGYLALDPSQSEMQKRALAHGKLGAAKKVDEKWRKFSSLFAQYFRRTVRPDGKLSLEERQALVDDFGHHLVEQRTKGATDKRSVANIKDFVSTLLTLMDRNADEDLIQSTWQELRTGREDQRKEKASGDFFYGAAETKLKRAGRTGAQIPQPFAEDLTAHAGGKLRGKAGKFRRTTFSSLELETFKTCFKIVRDASRCENSSSGRRGNRRGGA